MKLIDKAALVAEIEKQNQLIFPKNTGEMKVADVPKPLEQGWLNALSWIKKTIDSLEVKEVDEQKEGMSECPYRKVGCTMYEDTILECNGACSWVVDYLKLKELKVQKEKQNMEKYNKNDGTWVVDYRVYPEQGYYITNKKKNEYR